VPATLSLEGVLRETPADPHVARRQQVLRRERWYPAPPGTTPHDVSADDLVDAFARIKVGVESHGVVLLRFDRLLTNPELISLAGLLGVPQLQSDERLAPYVEDEVILNLRADHTETADLTWQLLFAENYVMMHSELAGRLIPEQVRYLMFQCVAAPVRDEGGQTLLVPMAAVRALLTDRQAAILRSTRHGAYANPPMFLTDHEGRDVFAVKDAEGEDLPWRYDGDDPTVTADEVDDALRALLGAIYDEPAATGVPWEPLMLGVFDNTRFLHARTFSRRPVDAPARHLREIRVFLGAG
jgi:alpha-ketoglutarate-dependent taurine dioxygenase